MFYPLFYCFSNFEIACFPAMQLCIVLDYVNTYNVRVKPYENIDLLKEVDVGCLQGKQPNNYRRLVDSLFVMITEIFSYF